MVIVDAQPNDSLPRFIRRARVEEITSLSKSEIYRRVKAGAFPAPVDLSEGEGRGTRWLLSEVLAWMAARIQERGSRPAKAMSRSERGRFADSRPHDSTSA